ncbi:MAG: hypothetical protein M2R45_03113 [Verrucomicrobia subdivision 3 bacterium]|nr:hypothetical protein [Limisphaerales bacterium]MCS1413181.1 hypothetical protein [Limisphaerales bacterium]
MVKKQIILQCRLSIACTEPETSLTSWTVVAPGTDVENPAVEIVLRDTHWRIGHYGDAK